MADADSDHMQDAAELRGNIARSLQGHASSIVKDATAVYAFAGIEHIGADERARIADLVFQLITTAVRDGSVDTGSPVLEDLGRLAAERDLGPRLLFSIVYLMERSALDELALDESFGVASEPWAALTQVVRRASFDVCGAMSEHMNPDGVKIGLTDSLTTLHTRPVFVAALEKEIQRAERFGDTFALIVLDVDHLADINARHGYGAGDRVLERMGFVVRSYFRETDWVARMGEDTFAVLLPDIQGADAERLADRMRITVQERLQLHDYRSEQEFPITVSVAVLVAESVDRRMKAERLLADAEEAVDRAKEGGRNRVERVEASVGDATAPTPDIIPID